MHTCHGCDTLPATERAWHGLYAAWYDHREAGHRLRAALYGWVADLWCRAVWG